MKSLIFLLIGLLTIPAAWAQNVGVGTASPAASAKLDISSTTQGFLPPRMTSAQRNAIVNPANGLVIYCTDCGYGQLNVYTYGASSWTSMDGSTAPWGVTPLVIGQDYGGGKLAYILQFNDYGYDANVPHGIIAAPMDQTGTTDWGCLNIAIPGADNAAIGWGNQNTLDMLAGCPTSGAALSCLNLTLNGFNDWYLPSRAELVRLHSNRVAIGGFSSSAGYWSSTENSNSNAEIVNFQTGIYPSASKDMLLRVRAVRSF